MPTTGRHRAGRRLAGPPGTPGGQAGHCVHQQRRARQGGQEATLLALYHTLFHWGSVILPTGYVDDDLSHAAGGNPHGVSSIGGDGPPSEHVLALARFQGRRRAELSRALRDRAAAAV